MVCVVLRNHLTGMHYSGSSVYQLFILGYLWLQKKFRRSFGPPKYTSCGPKGLTKAVIKQPKGLHIICSCAAFGSTIPFGSLSDIVAARRNSLYTTDSLYTNFLLMLLPEGRISMFSGNLGPLKDFLWPQGRKSRIL